MLFVSVPALSDTLSRLSDPHSISLRPGIQSRRKCPTLYRLLRYMVTLCLFFLPSLSTSPSLSSFTTSPLLPSPPPPLSPAVSHSSGGSSHHILTHPEVMTVHLKSDDIGFGLSLHGGVSGRRYRPLKIAVIEHGGPAAL